MTVMFVIAAASVLALPGILDSKASSGSSTGPAQKRALENEGPLFGYWERRSLSIDDDWVARGNFVGGRDVGFAVWLCLVRTLFLFVDDVLVFFVDVT
jgi:hypothetical protein